METAMMWSCTIGQCRGLLPLSYWGFGLAYSIYVLSAVLTGCARGGTMETAMMWSCTIGQCRGLLPLSYWGFGTSCLLDLRTFSRFNRLCPWWCNEDCHDVVMHDQ